MVGISLAVAPFQGLDCDRTVEVVAPVDWMLMDFVTESNHCIRRCLQLRTGQDPQYGPAVSTVGRLISVRLSMDTCCSIFGCTAVPVMNWPQDGLYPRTRAPMPDSNQASEHHTDADGPTSQVVSIATGDRSTYRALIVI